MRNGYRRRICSSLPHSAYYADWVKQGEREGAKQLGISLYTLMERAGLATFTLCRQLYPLTAHWLILCGNGNNGGDGYVVARLAKQAGVNVILIACEGQTPLPDEAAEARRQWLDAQGDILDASSPWPQDIDLIVDGLLGIGIRSAPRLPYSTLIDAANAHPAPVVAIDIPSGLQADTGSVPGAVIRAAHTHTFVALKPGLLTGQARDWVGCLHYADLGLATWFETQKPQIHRVNTDNLVEWFQPRRPCAHKGEFGKLLLIGGDLGMGGAIRMAGEAALRSGAGLVRVLTHPFNVAPILTARPELMVQAFDKAVLAEALNWADTLVIGPGLGQGEWGKEVFKLVKGCDKTALWDADVLNLLAIAPQKRQNRVLTPHPGEASRLLGCSIAEIESDRLLSARRLVERYGGVVVLKGAGTIIAQDSAIAIADVGNPGMATGGMGDVLSGIIGGLMAQKAALFDAACAGCVIHGAAADSVAAQYGERGLLATDLLPAIPKYVNPEKNNPK